MFSVYLTWFTTTKSATLSHQLTVDKTFSNFALVAGLLPWLAWQFSSSICSNIIKVAESRLNKWAANIANFVEIYLRPLKESKQIFWK